MFKDTTHEAWTLIAARARHKMRPRPAMMHGSSIKGGSAAQLSSVGDYYEKAHAVKGS